MANLEKTIACYKEIGFKPTLNNFEDRLIAQKAACLLEIAGVNLGYHFSLYIHGPYSPFLTKEIFDNDKAVEKLSTSVSLNEREIEICKKMKNIFELNQPSLLEIAATYAYFVNKRGYDSLEAIGQVKALKPYYSEKQIAVGVSKATDFLAK